MNPRDSGIESGLRSYANKQTKSSKYLQIPIYDCEICFVRLLLLVLIKYCKSIDEPYLIIIHNSDRFTRLYEKDSFTIDKMLLKTLE